MKQRDRITAKLKEDGEITSVWAMQHGIFRLSERIRELEEVGWSFNKSFVEIDGRKTKTYRYTVADRPKRVVYDLVVRDGREVRVPRLV